MGWSVAASQSRAVLSSLPVRTVLPSGLNATARTLSRCRMGSPERVARSPRPRACAVLSLPPVRSGLAVGAEAPRTQTPVARCCSGRPMGWPVAASQSRAVPSPLAVRSGLPSGLNATDADRALMHEGLADGPMGGGVPEPCRLVRRSR